MYFLNKSYLYEVSFFELSVRKKLPSSKLGEFLTREYFRDHLYIMEGHRGPENGNFPLSYVMKISLRRGF